MKRARQPGDGHWMNHSSPMVKYPSPGTAHNRPSCPSAHSYSFKHAPTAHSKNSFGCSGFPQNPTFVCGMFRGNPWHTAPSGTKEPFASVHTAPFRARFFSHCTTSVPGQRRRAAESQYKAGQVRPQKKEEKKELRAVFYG